MRIGYDAKRVFNNTSGLGNYGRTLIENFVQTKGHNCVLYTPKSQEAYASWYAELKTDNVQIRTTDLPKYLHGYWRSRSIVKDIINDEIDVYHGLSNEIPFGLSKTKIRTVTTIHDLIYKSYPQDFSWFDRQMYEHKFRHAALHSDRLIAVSHSTKRDIIDFFGIEEEKIDVIYQTCGPIFWQQPTEKDLNKIKTTLGLPDRFILSVGAISSRKNLKLTLRSLDQLKSDLDLHLVVVGKGKKYKNQCKKLIHDLGLENRVHFLSNIDSDVSLRAIYYWAEALVYPSFYEGFGIPIIEAGLCGCPAIVANTSALCEAGGPHILSINPKRPDQLSDALKKLLTNSDYRTEYIFKSKTYVEKKFDPSTLTDQLNEVYLGML